MRKILGLLGLLLAGSVAAQTLPPVPPIADANRYQSYTLNSSTAAIDLQFPLFGACQDLTVKQDGVALTFGSAWTCVSKSGNPLSSLPQPITDAQVQFTPPLTSGFVEIIGNWRPRQTTQPTSPGITRREFNQITGNIIASLREAWRGLANAMQAQYASDGSFTWDARSARIVGLADPVSPTDAATRQWVLSTYTGVGLLSGIAGAATDNATLKTVASTAFRTIIRLGFTTPGDSPQVLYTNSDSPCSLNGGDGDDGSQVKSADGKCWLALLPGDVNPRMFGAKGVDTDDTVAIQRAAVAACAAGRRLSFDAGVYLVTGTISLTNCQNFEITTAAPGDKVIIHRTGSYGDTFLIGSLATPALALRVSGLWFLQGPTGIAAYTPGQTTLANRATDGGAHIHVVGGQNVLISGNTFWRGQYAIELTGGSIFRIEHNRYLLVWDHVNSGAQEGIADLYSNIDGNGANPKDLFEFGDTHLGAISASRVATLPDSSTHTMQEFVGPQHSVLLRGMETAHFAKNYFGDGNVSNICLCTQVGGLVANVGITNDNFFDGARIAQIQIVPDSGATTVYGVSISGVFNGEFGTKNHILIPNIGTSPSAYDVTISGFTMAATYGSGIVLTGAVGGTIGMGTITSYNAFNLSTSDAQYVAAVYADAYSKHLNIGPLTVGGGGNAYSQTTGTGDFAYQGVTVLDTNTTGVISSSLVHDILDAGIVSP